MALRDELHEMVLWRMSEIPLAQRVFEAGNQPVPTNPIEGLQITYAFCRGLHDALMRLADEVDALKLVSGDSEPDD